MNKKFLITILCAIGAGAGSAYMISRLKPVETRTELVTVAESPARLTFASEPQKNGSGFPDLTEAAENTVKAVVNIVKMEEVETPNAYGYGYGYDPFLEMFGIPQGRQQRQSQPQQRRSGGSGVIISPDGYIITNNHVSENAKTLKVTLSDDRSFDAKVIGADPTTDIALLKIDATDLPTISFGDSDDLRLGEWVLAVGNPYGLNSTVTAGIISAKSRDLGVIPSDFRIESFIQTDAAVNPGNSGGALVNTKGELIGINTVIASPTGSYAGYSFAVPSSIVKKVIVDLKEYGIVQRALLGIEYSPINEAFLESEQGKETGIKETGGLYIGKVVPGGAAEEAGIKPGDILIEFEGNAITGSSQLQEAIAKHRPNEKVDVAVKRKGEVKHFEVLLRNKAGEAKLLEKNSVDVASVLGGEFREVSEKTMRNLRINSGIQVVKIGSGLLKKSGIQEGYIITHINGKAIRSVSDLNKITDPVQSIDGLYPNGRYASYSIINN